MEGSAIKSDNEGVRTLGAKPGARYNGCSHTRLKYREQLEEAACRLATGD